MMKEKMKNILVIDDDPGVLFLLQRRLSDAGYRVAVEVSGQMGLERMAVSAPDLVIVDIRMPGMDGFAFIRQIRTDAVLVKVPAIIVTAYEEYSADAALLEGVQGFFRKPIEINGLLGKIREIVGE
jgi:CheY-like chemotaxis protein